MQPIKFNHIDGYINKLTHFYFIAFYYMHSKCHKLGRYASSWLDTEMLLPLLAGARNAS